MILTPPFDGDPFSSGLPFAQRPSGAWANPGRFSLIPPNPYLVRPNWANPLTRGLAFLFLPDSRNQYVDIIRRVPLTKFSGTITKQFTSFGSAYQFGDPANVSGGNAVTANDPYYVPRTTNTLSLAYGSYNTATITGNGSTNYIEFQTIWFSDATNSHGLLLYIQNSGSSLSAAVTAVTTATNTGVTATLGVGTNFVTAGEGISGVGVLNGTAISIAAMGTHTQFATGSGTTSGNVAGTSGNIQMGSGTAGNANSANRALTYVAGWFRALSSTEMATIAVAAGGLPPNFLWWI